jgi:hypothetical protein
MKEKKILEEIARFREISKIDNKELVNEGVLGDILKAILFGDKDLSWEEILDRFFKKVKEKKLLSKVDVDFKEMTKMVIDKLEGGYYNPKWHYKPQMGRSGETMFGIDRIHGGRLNTSEPGVEFWSIIDKNKNPKVWKHGYRGGELENKLMDLVVRIMEPHYKELSDKYLSQESKEIVNSDKGLTFNFIYASWNGSGFFQRFANDINEAVKEGETDPKELQKIAIDSRDKTILGSTNKIEKIMGGLNSENIS